MAREIRTKKLALQIKQKTTTVLMKLNGYPVYKAVSTPLTQTSQSAWMKSTTKTPLKNLDLYGGD